MIQFPVTLAFDKERGGLSRYLKHSATIWVRYDISDRNAAILYCKDSEPKATSEWIEDKFGLLIDVMPYGTYKHIEEEAFRNPADYFADREEGERRQEEVNRERAA